ncbi:MAG TPA: hypothetical protein PKE63_06780, partial [Lacibacter sp.]|nr:hypothetical protein [Lacibacter sp.]
SILVVAIGANVLAHLIGARTWYDFIGLLNKDGMAAAFRQLSWKDLLWLFVVYPFLLGCSYLPGKWFYEWLTGNA